ncbi:helix-turn-helix domain-containing protein [Bacillus sp. 1P06AnD]|uniref:helix-turn-helix domain-containing protein n=1 Tax=Bacillus sp. 1P06AnD TaxID=3132208 RepID=UPI0039A17412
MDNLDTFAKRLKKLRDIEGITGAQLAEAIGKSHTALRMWESDRAYPDYLTMKKIADYFGCSYDFLFGKNNLKLDKVHRIEKGIDALLKEIHS